MKAVILAGGRGERLRPLTDAVPKPMIRIKGRPFLEHQLELLKKNGITSFLLCVGYLKEAVIDHFGDGSRFGLKIEYSTEGSFLGTAGAIKQAEGLLPGEFILLYGDSYLPIDYAALVDAWFKRDCSGLVVCYDNSLHIAQNNIYLSPDNRIISYNKRSPDSRANYVEAGVSILKKEILGLIPPAGQVSLEEEIFPLLARDGLLKGYPTSQRYYDIGAPERLKSIEEVLL
ncbi:MAG: nucleotidyltransferase family protein [Candidatus Omnitrophota bacterium]